LLLWDTPQRFEKYGMQNEWITMWGNLYAKGDGDVERRNGNRILRHTDSSVFTADKRKKGKSRESGKRKKEVQGLILCLLLMVGIIWTVTQRNQYQICGQFTLGSSSWRQTTMNVIVGSRFANIEQITDEIIREHRRVNYESSSERLVLKLYRSKWELLQGQYFREMVLDCNDDDLDL
jgi:hypothetical protein